VGEEVLGRSLCPQGADCPRWMTGAAAGGACIAWNLRSLGSLLWE